MGFIFLDIKMDSSEESSVYRKGIVKLIQAGKINLNDLAEIEISSEEESDKEDLNDVPEKVQTNENSNSIEKSAEKNETPNSNENSAEVEKDFEPIYRGAQKTLDDIPTVVAQLNTELDILLRGENAMGTMSSNHNDLEEFIWRFHITFEWNNEHISLPIQRTEDIEKLNSALNDAPTYHRVVSFH